MKKKNKLNNILEEIVNQYLGDFSIEKPEIKTEISESEKEIEIISVENDDEKEIDKTDHVLMLESLRYDFFNMLNTTKKLEEKKDLSDQLEDIAKNFF
jgi:hypothetical protein